MISGRFLWQLSWVPLGTIGFVTNALGEEAEDSEKIATTLSVGGYAKLDVLVSKYRDGEIAPDSLQRDMHFPSQIPVGGHNHIVSDLRFHARESRFYLSTTTKFRNDEELYSYVELDFMLSDQGNELISNSYTPRMRHFYFTYDALLLGQTWSTFMFSDLLVDDLDFIGTADGVLFVRQPQIRFSWKGLKVALENPKVTWDEASGERVTNELGSLPDAVLKYDHGGKFGSLSGALIARQLKVQYLADDGAADSKSAFGFGASLGGRTDFWRNDDFRYQFTVGSGLGRYAALNFANAAFVDNEQRISPRMSYLGFVGIRHFWSACWRSNVNISGIHVDNNGGSQYLNRRAASASVNLLFSPLKPLTFGAEFMRGYRQIENGDSGVFDRVQLSAIYHFDYTTPSF